MNKTILLFSLTLLLSGCLPQKQATTIESTSSATNESTISTTQTTSDSQTSTTSTSSSTSSTSTTTEIPIKKQTIKQIKTNATEGEIVTFEATYLRNLTWVNEDLMYFADADDYIWFRVPYASYQGYLSSRYTFQEYSVKGKFVRVNDQEEIIYDSSFTPQESIVNLGENYPLSYDENKVAKKLSGIKEIKAKCGQIDLNNKGYGAGEIVQFTSQAVQTEYEDANKKVMVLDSDGNTITVIADERKMINKEDIGKYYTWTGIISIKSSIPAIMGLSCKYVQHLAQEEAQIDVSCATEVLPSYFKKWNLTSNNWTPASNDDYFKLYKSTGYIVNNLDITTSYNIGMVDNFGDSLSDAGSTKTVAGFYIVNCTNLKDNDLKYCPLSNYINQNIPVTLYYGIRQYDTTNHLWKMFVIEKIIQTM